METHCPDHALLQHEIDVHDRRINAHGKEIDELKDDQGDIKVTINELKILSEYAQKRIDQADQRASKQDEALAELKNRPAQGVLSAKNAAMNAIGAAIGVGTVGLIAMAIVNST